MFIVYISSTFKAMGGRTLSFLFSVVFSLIKLIMFWHFFDPVYIILSNLPKLINSCYIFNLLWNPLFCKAWKCYNSVFIKSQKLSSDSQIVHADLAESSDSLTGLTGYIFKEITTIFLKMFINKSKSKRLFWLNLVLDLQN